MESTHITYRIKLSEKKTEVLDYELDGETFDLITKEISDPPDWAKLEFNQCSHCPLSVKEHPYCPVALQLHDIIERFHDTRSIDEVEVEVVSDERKVVKTSAIQTAIASLFSLVFPLCGCPKTEYMKPMARFHMPLASEEESIFHVTGMYLLSQYFLHKGENRDPFGGLSEMYDDLHILNKSIKDRVTSATTSDSVKNAITLIDMNSTLIPLLIEDELVELRGFFKAYLPEDGGEEIKTPGHLEKAKAFKLELVPIEGEEEAPANPFALPDDEHLPSEMEAKEEPEEEEEEIAAHIDTSRLSLEEIKEDEPEGFGGIEFESVSPEELAAEKEAESEPEAEEEKAPEADFGGLSLVDYDGPATEDDSNKAVYKLPDD